MPQSVFHFLRIIELEESLWRCSSLSLNIHQHEFLGRREPPSSSVADAQNCDGVDRRGSLERSVGHLEKCSESRSKLMQVGAKAGWQTDNSFSVGDGTKNMLSCWTILSFFKLYVSVLLTKIWLLWLVSVKLVLEWAITYVYYGWWRLLSSRTGSLTVL